MTDKIKMVEKIEKTINYFMKVTKNSATRPIRKRYYQMKKQFQFRYKIGQWIKKNINRITKMLAGKPIDLSHYIALGNHYVAKKLMLILLIIIICLPMVYFKYLKPKLEGKLWVPAFIANTENFNEYTGPAKLLSKDSNLVYSGDLKDGRCTGKGKLYDPDGNLVYNGEFLLDQYSGTGEKYYSNGKVLYKGQFLENQFEGQGSLYDEEGNLIYEGNFVQGNYEGRGKEYYEQGSVKYEGDFLSNTYHGQGFLYTKEEKLKYKGQFENGEMSGDGTLFDQYGNIIYEGNFSRDYYEGQGKIYDKNGNRVYEGEFKKGKYDGLGILYDKLGREVYKGNFKNGKINYLYYLGLSAEEVRNSFVLEPTTDILEDEFCMTYNSFKITFVLDFATEEEAPKVKAIRSWNEENYFETKRQNSANQLKKIYGKAVEEGEVWASEKDIVLLSNDLLNKKMNQDIRDLNVLYITKFIKDHYYVTFYFIDKKSKVYLYSEVEECNN
ncbi:MORN repeat-containing protein [Crassaminicella profunda]|uniref:MORN repeat-containing protein n=1 Tax=Crassaminicella profunda TaxID=1286698 RepID=UPI001CA76929|nr:hypothetical protein [Crassaminicella profunda]QZY54463.1 hypothetical protein K7H06_15670 [Crassaminicella profunda]